MKFFLILLINLEVEREKEVFGQIEKYFMIVEIRKFRIALRLKKRYNNEIFIIIKNTIL